MIFNKTTSKIKVTQSSQTAHQPLSSYDCLNSKASARNPVTDAPTLWTVGNSQQQTLQKCRLTQNANKKMCLWKSLMHLMIVKQLWVLMDSLRGPMSVATRVGSKCYHGVIGVFPSGCIIPARNNKSKQSSLPSTSLQQRFRFKSNEGVAVNVFKPVIKL